MSRPSSKAIYMHRKEYLNSLASEPKGQLSAVERNPRAEGAGLGSCAWSLTRLRPGPGSHSGPLRPKALAPGASLRHHQPSLLHRGALHGGRAWGPLGRLPASCYLINKAISMGPGKLVAGDLGPDPVLGPSVKEAETGLPPASRQSQPLCGRFSSAHWEVNVGS